MLERHIPPQQFSGIAKDRLSPTFLITVSVNPDHFSRILFMQRKIGIEKHVEAVQKGREVPPPARPLPTGVEQTYADILRELPIAHRDNPAMRTLALEAAETVAQLDRANAALAAEGEVLTDTKGKRYPNPWVKIRNDALNHARSTFGKLRLFPTEDKRELQRVAAWQRDVSGGRPATLANKEYPAFVYPE